MEHREGNGSWQTAEAIRQSRTLYVTGIYGGAYTEREETACALICQLICGMCSPAHASSYVPFSLADTPTVIPPSFYSAHI